MVPVEHSVRADVGREYLTLDVPNGWDDVKKLCKKVLTFDGRQFTFTGWNSDTNKCFFVRLLSGTPRVATIS
jgi:hypothetical protein